jgi:hypothetical protein
VLSSPWSLEFVVAVIIGAMLVPGCRADKRPAAPSPISAVGASQFSSGPTAAASHRVIVVGRPETPPVVPAPVGPVRLQLP